MNELERKINWLKEEKLTGISFFMTAGYPDMKTFSDTVRELDRRSLADFIEVGVPFSDPLADGPVIQNSSREAIKQGASLGNIFEAVRKIKKDTALPMVMMSYLNPLTSGAGLEKNLKCAADSGFSAVIIPDLPAGESAEIEKTVKKPGLGHVFLAAPSTPDERIREISLKSSPFLYYVSSYGVTGARRSLDSKLASRLERVRKLSRVPVYCGFGISTPAQAALLKKSLDGIIIGSAFIDKLKTRHFKAPLKFAISINKSLGRM